LKKKVQQKLNLFYTACMRLKKAQLCGWAFYTLCCGWLVGIKKEPNFRWVLFIPFEKVEKKANLAVDFFIPPSGFEPLLREWKSRVLGH
jgi:hypothetical protein